MKPLIFKNKHLRKLLKISQQATVFKATFTEAVKAYEKDTNKPYKDENLDRYYEQSIPTIWLVKDEGIYLMTSAKLDIYPNDNSHVCYAEGFEPDAPNSWEKCRAAVGGDDFVESFELDESIKKGISHGADILIQITSESYQISLVYS